MECYHIHRGQCTPRARSCENIRRARSRVKELIVIANFHLETAFRLQTFIDERAKFGLVVQNRIFTIEKRMWEASKEITKEIAKIRKLTHPPPLPSKEYGLGQFIFLSSERQL